MYLVAVSHLDWVILQTKRELMAKKKKNNNAQSMSPEKYIITKARKLPLGKTYISRHVAKGGIYVAIVTRVHSSGKLTAGVYLIDTYCLGVKDSFYYRAMDPDEFEERFLSGQVSDFEETEYAEVHNLIYGALEYAEEAGINPCTEFRVSEYILEPDNNSIPLMYFDFGHNGVRELVIGPDRREMKHIPTLEKNVPGEFIITGHLASYQDEFSDEEYHDEEYSYDAVTGNDDPNSFNFDFHPFPHAPYPEDVEEVRHKELFDIFYPEKFSDMPGITLNAKQIATIRTIPRDELIDDLRVMTAYELGQAESEIKTDGCYNDVDSNVMYHICAILAEIGGNDTKDLVNSIMQQSYYWQEAYLGDFGLEISHSLLANAYEDCPEELARMVVEQGYSAHARTTMLFALECIALWNPIVRDRVEKELIDLAELILHSDGSNLPLLNDYTVGTLSSVIIGLRMKSALPLVKEMHDRNLVDEKVFGDYEDDLAELTRLDESEEYIETRYTSLEQIYKSYK